MLDTTYDPKEIIEEAFNFWSLQSLRDRCKLSDRPKKIKNPKNNYEKNMNKCPYSVKLYAKYNGGTGLFDEFDSLFQPVEWWDIPAKKVIPKWQKQCWKKFDQVYNICWEKLPNINTSDINTYSSGKDNHRALLDKILADLEQNNKNELPTPYGVGNSA